MNAKHLRTSREWYTPDYVLNPAREYLGGAIDLDPASCAEANTRVGARMIYTKEHSGLDPLHVWHGSVFLNPPGDKLVKPFYERLMREISISVWAFVWIGFSLEQLQTLQNAATELHPNRFDLVVPRKRIPFDAPHGEKKQSPTHANYILGFGHSLEHFRRTLGTLGDVYPGDLHASGV